MDLTTLFNKITKLEQVALPLFVVNPSSQALAGVAFLGEQAIFNWIEAMHAKTTPAAPVAIAPATPVATAPAAASTTLI